MANNYSPVQSYGAYLKRKMIITRLLGILACLIALGSIALMYYKIVSEWMCIIAIGYAMATAFSSNSFIQGVKVGNPWQRINMFCAIFFYLAVIALIVYGFINGELSLQF